MVLGGKHQRIWRFSGRNSNKAKSHLRCMLQLHVLQFSASVVLRDRSFFESPCRQNACVLSVLSLVYHIHLYRWILTETPAAVEMVWSSRLVYRSLLNQRKEWWIVGVSPGSIDVFTMDAPGKVHFNSPLSRSPNQDHALNPKPWTSKERKTCEESCRVFPRKCRLIRDYCKMWDATWTA